MKLKIVMITPFPIKMDCTTGGVAGVSMYLTYELNKIPDVTVEVIVPDAPVAQKYSID